MPIATRRWFVLKSQTVVPFGVGAVFDIQGESFVAAGIGDWPARTKQRIGSPRLADRLGVTGFHAAPATANDRFDVADAPGAPYIRFPSWLFCGACRRMKRWRIADEKHGQAPRCPSCPPPARTLAPMRFVQICQAGHLGDVDWWFWAHSRCDGGERRHCEERERLRFLVSERASGLEALSVTCTAKGCGATRDLLDVLGTHGMRLGTQPVAACERGRRMPASGADRAAHGGQPLLPRRALGVGHSRDQRPRAYR
ncbi:hypothetical protein [Streptomyces sp. M2CJ-2]|uniref:hypothetical protein n=1 Tax=Streptomyces sp. M2CJ-2 TaxID=2803948 RepID=UPI001F47725D|nr:hypothetical protein [Streptomyces sp. M2CJ-2]